MILTGHASQGSINRAFDLKATLVTKPIAPQRIVSFVQRAESSLQDRVDATVASWVTSYDLSESEGDILLRAARGDRRLDIASGRHTSPKTVRTRITSLLRKTGDVDLLAAIERLIREAAGP